MQNKKYKIFPIIFNIFYMMMWLIPFYFFTKDFLKPEIFTELRSNNFSFYSLKNSFLQGILSVFFSFIIAIIPAYYMSYNKNIFTKILDKLFFIPFVFPVVSTVIAFSLIFNLSFFRKIGLNYTLTNIIIVNCFYNSPIFLKYIAEALKKIPKEFVEEAQIQNASDFQIFYKIKLPLIFPQILRGAFLVFLYSFTSFIIVIAIGGLKFSTIEADIATTLIGSLNFSRVIILGFMQGFILIFINALTFKVKEYELNGEQYLHKTPKILLYISWIYFIFIFSIFIIGITFSFYNFYSGEFSFKPYVRIFSSNFNEVFPIFQSLKNSFSLSFLCGFIVTLFAYLMIKAYNKFTNFILFFTMGLSVAFISITLIYLNINFNVPVIILLVVAYILISLPLGYSFMYQYLKNFSVEILEVAKIDGCSLIKRFIFIEFPLLKKIFLWVFMQIFVIIFGEFTIGYTMQIGNTFPIVPLVNYSLLSSKYFLESAALNTVTLLFLTIILSLTQKLVEEKLNKEDFLK
ncbi:MAG: ABC transporter permease [Fusobacteriaceae bacterium]